MKPMSVAASMSGIIGCSGQALAAWSYYNEPTGPTPLGPANLTFAGEDSLRLFNGGVCVHNYLDEKEREILAKGPQINHDVWPKLKSENTFANARGKADGCVAISWIKETWNEGFYKARLRYEWIFTVGDESLVTFGIFNPEDDLHRITWKTTYIRRNTNNYAWIVRAIDKNHHVPLKPGNANVYWGYKPSDISNLGLLCKYAKRLKCIDDGHKIFGEEKWTWVEDEEGNKKFTDWTKNFSTAFSYINEFKNLNGFMNLVNSRTGTWTRR